MKVAVFSTHQFEKNYLIAANKDKHELQFFEEKSYLNKINITDTFSLTVNNTSRNNNIIYPL